MSNQDQNNQIFRQGHNLLTQFSQIIDYYDNKVRILEQQIETLQKKNSEIQPNTEKLDKKITK